MLPPMGILSMQRSVGNQAIMRSLAGDRIQRDNPRLLHLLRRLPLPRIPQ